jgi:hypothetical protein
MATSRICTIDGCGKSLIALGLCGMHYQRLRNGTDMLKPSTADGAPMAFIELVSKTLASVTDCIKWPYATNSQGYGHLNVNGAYPIASRLVCELAHGKPTFPKAEAAHSCGNGHEGCVNPNHLSWKTSSGNKADMVRHGTRLTGERNPNSRLTVEQVSIIKEGIRARVSDSQLAHRFGVTSNVVWKIRHGRMWRQVE